MIDFLTQKLKLPALVTLLVLLPLQAMASTVDIYRYTTNGDRVTLRVRVLGDDNIPIQGLTKKKFHIQTTDKQGKSIKSSTFNFDLISPEKQSQPDPAYVVILLDMSGSMRHPDTSGEQKLSGAIAAIEQFMDTAQQRKIPLHLSLVPFGYRGDNQCNYLYPVDNTSIAKDAPFLEVKNDKLKNKLKELAGVKVCAATNLYQPVVAATTYLRNQFTQVVSNVSQENTPQPRLAVILLSDGYDETSEEKFTNLKRFLQQSPHVTVHTLGYGESLNQLRERADCSESISKQQLTPNNISRYCRLPKQDIREFMIDEHRLQEIASTTGGIYKLSANAYQVAKSLTDFLTSLREYEIVYRQPEADRASRHQTTVRVNSTFLGLNNVTSQPRDIRMDNFVYNSLSIPERLRILLFSICLVVLGIFPFLLWSQWLKQQAERNLEI